jgi:hypothetical protein
MRFVKLRSFFVILFLLSALLSQACLPDRQAQYAIDGVVVDAENNQPLPGASVFLSNTTKGASADVNGEFHITGLKAVSYQMVVSFIGYKTEIFDVSPEKLLSYKIILTPSKEVLKEVVVHSKKMTKEQWLQALKTFEDNFIGFADNAKNCKIINTKALDFEKNGNVLTAYTDSTLMIENRGLGYKMKILLQDYRYDLRTTQLIYVGPMSYELLTPKNKKETLRWARARLKAYNGSQMHFFRSLYNRRLNEEGFYFRFPGKLQGDDSVKIVKSRVFRKGLPVGTINNYYKILSDSLKPELVLRYKGILEVQYVGEIETRQYQLHRSSGIKKTPQWSAIKLNSPAVIQPDGQPFPVTALQFGGYWSWELMSETLPLDYEPTEDLAIVNDD